MMSPKHKHSVNHCSTQWLQKKGQLVCKSDHIKFKHLRAKITKFIPREIEFFKLVKFLQSEHKLAHYRGLPGVGKTYLVRNVLHYLCERKYFSAGILYFPLNEMKRTDQFLLEIRDKVVSFFKMNYCDKFDFKKDYSTIDDIQDFLVDFFEDKALQQFELIKKKNFSQSKDRRFLLVLDNCESLIDHCGEQFRGLLSDFTDQCKMLKILVVSRNELGSTLEGEEL